MKSMTFSRSLLSRRRQAEILSIVGKNGKAGTSTGRSAARERTVSITVLELLAVLNRPASRDARLPHGTLAAILQKNAHGDCYTSHRRFASARASKPLL